MSAPLLVFVKDFEFVTLVAQPFKTARERCTEFVDTLQRVVESDDGTVAGIAFHVLKHLVGIESLGVVARHEVPHHDGEMMAHLDVLSVAHPSVRRSEEFRLNEAVGFVHVPYIIFGMHQPGDVVVGVVAHTVPTSFHLFEEFGILPHVVAHHEESSLHSVLVENVKNPRRGFRNGSVVEGDIHCLLLRVHSPDGTGIEPSHPLAWLFNNHFPLSQVNS